MTIAAAYALRDDNVNGYWTVADSRLTVGPKATDTFVKTIDLADGVALTVAGSTLASTAAAELIRPLIAGHNRTPGFERISFYDTSRIFAYFARKIYLELGRDDESDALLCGFYRDGSPGIAHFELHRGRVHFYKPPRGGRCGVVIGADHVRPMIRLAFARTRGLRDGFDRFISLIYTIIVHEGAPYSGIGGGIAFGFCDGPELPVQWPILQIDSERFYRGFSVRGFERPTWQAPILVKLDQEFSAMIEQEASAPEADGADFVQYRPRATWPIDGARPDQLFMTTFDPEVLLQD